MRVVFAGAGCAGHPDEPRTKTAGASAGLWSHLHGIKGTLQNTPAPPPPGEHSPPPAHTGFHGRLVSRQVMEEFRRKRKGT